ncbi:MAG: DUF2252 domain-containing protein [Candidatus Angelobacter sp. Gp1-AA117]|nr:MAG: DUF2252 domain-containing protein [Candidatus Angelobacter sp. Gp1-AA117]
MKDHRSRKDAEKFGHSQRREFSRSDLGKFNAGKRNFDPIAIIKDSCRNRVPDLLPVKFKLMADSMFAFYRGTVEIMAADLAAEKHTQIEAQLCGDAHIRNFGFYATPDAQVTFDINDFDATCRGPWEWDVKRLVTSVILAGREAGETPSKCRRTAQMCAAEYCSWMRRFARMSTVDVARHRVQRDLRQPVLRDALMKAERASAIHILPKMAHKTKDGWRFRKIPGQVLKLDQATRETVMAALPAYRATLSPDHQMLFDRFDPADAAFKIAGTGSVGTRDYVILLFGRDAKDPLFLQVKEEPPCAYASYLNQPQVANDGERVVLGQRALQVQSDLLLGWCSIEKRDYLVRQLNDHKSSLDIQTLKGRRLIEYGTLCAELLARGHARSGDPIAIATYSGSSAKAATALVEFALKYADQVAADYKAFLKARKSGALDKR